MIEKYESVIQRAINLSRYIVQVYNQPTSVADYRKIKGDNHRVFHLELSEGPSMTLYSRGNKESWESFNLYMKFYETSNVTKVPLFYHELIEILGGVKNLGGGTLFWNKYECETSSIWFYVSQHGGHIIWRYPLSEVYMLVKDGIVNDIYGSTQNENHGRTGPRELTPEEPQKLEEMLNVLEPWVKEVIGSQTKKNHISHIDMTKLTIK